MKYLTLVLATLIVMSVALVPPAQAQTTGLALSFVQVTDPTLCTPIATTTLCAVVPATGTPTLMISLGSNKTFTQIFPPPSAAAGTVTSVNGIKPDTTGNVVVPMTSLMPKGTVACSNGTIAPFLLTGCVVQ